MALNYFFRILAGRPKADIAFDADNIPTANEKSALGAAPNALSANNPVADKQYVDSYLQGLDWQESVQVSIDYVKSDAGAPSGTPASGEKCLNTNEAKLYSESGGVWDAGVAATSGQRFIHKDPGSDTSGDSGTYTPSNKIYTYNGVGFEEFSPSEGSSSWVEDEDSLFVFNSTNWVQFGSTTTHNNLSGLQGGTSGQYYHLTAAQQLAIANESVREKVPILYKFAYHGGLAASQTDVEAYNESGISQRAVMPKNFRFVGITCQLSSGRTAGSLVIEPTINGTKITPSGLDLTIGETTPNDAYASVAVTESGYNGNAGQKIGVMLTTDSSWAPNDEDIEVTLLVVFD